MKTRFITLAAVVVVLILGTGCTLTVDPDGTRNWSIDGDEVARAIIIYSTK